MTTQEAIEFLPLYSAADDSDYVRHYEPKQKKQKPRQTHRKAPETPFRMQFDEKMRKFIKRYGLTFLAWFGFTVWTVLACCITGAIVQHNTTLEVRAQIEAENAEKAQAEKGASILTGESSLQAAIKADAKWLARVGQGVLNTYKKADLDDARKLMLCVVCRVHSSGESGEFIKIKSIEDAAKQPDQWFGFKEDLIYEKDVEKIALEISEIFHRKDAMPCPVDMCYAGWNGDEIVLRNHYIDNSSAKRY